MKKLAMLLMLLLALTIQSHRALAQSVTITLMPGWNWISVPLMDTLDFETALGSFTPMQGDIIKSQWSNASYINGQWRGPISQFYPGYGYMYYSNRPMPVMVTFTTQQPAPQVVVTTSEPTDITINSATCGGNVASSNGDYVSVTLRGICWSTSPNPTFNDNYIEAGSGLGSYSALLTELTVGPTYYVRAFAVTVAGTFYGNEVSFTTTPEGAISGLFTINSNGGQVFFSRGNLQYNKTTAVWSFMEHQYDKVETVEQYVGSNYQYQNIVSLFGWGTSGFNHGANCYQPWSTSGGSSNYYAYGNYTYSLYDQTGQADWGYNPISNGGNTVNQWRTLTGSEWTYVFYTRTTTSGILYAKANVNGVDGMILLPDDWSSSTYSLNRTNTYNAGFSSNMLTASQWATLENAGAVFLPAAGSREGPSVYYNAPYPSSTGYYWAADGWDNFAHSMNFGNSSMFENGDGDFRHHGQSVRLVRDAQ